MDNDCINMMPLYVLLILAIILRNGRPINDIVDITVHLTIKMIVRIHADIEPFLIRVYIKFFNPSCLHKPLQTNAAKAANNVDPFIRERGLCELSFIISMGSN